MDMKTVSLEWPGGLVTGRLVEGGTTGVLLAHGAGTNQDHQTMVALRDGLAAAGTTVLTFNYPYSEAGRRGPDSQTKLLACHSAVVEWFRPRIKTLVLAGRSMGGRMGTYLAAEGTPMDGLILFSYPLHPAGRPEKLRKDHLPQISVPMLFILGTRDPLSTMELYDRWVRPLAGVTTVEIEDGDHSFRVRKASGRTNRQALDEVLAAAVDWLGLLEERR